MSDAFDRIIGHGRAVKRLRLALANGSLPQTFLFCGPRHVGKLTLASALAESLLGSVPAHSPDFRPVGRSRDEKTGKLHKNISVEEVRELRAFLQMSPLGAGRKVAVIDEAETLSEEAGNALLKTLEEPSATTHVLLISHDAGAVLPTIRSRSAVFTLSRQPDECVAEALAARGVEGARAAGISALAAGRPGVALSLAEGGDMVDWYEAETTRWNSLNSGALGRRFALMAQLVPPGADREETVERLRDVIAVWETALRPELRRGSARAARILRRVSDLRKTLEVNVQPRLLLERFALALEGDT